jgi:hypothetical protein
MPAGAAADPCETSGEDATADEAVELALHQLRHALSSTCDGGREGRAVMTNRAMQWDVFDVTRDVARRQRRAGLGAARQPAVAARQRRGRDRVHPCTAVSARQYVRQRCAVGPHVCCLPLSRPAAPAPVPCGGTRLGPAHEGAGRHRRRRRRHAGPSLITAGSRAASVLVVAAVVAVVDVVDVVDDVVARRLLSALGHASGPYDETASWPSTRSPKPPSSRWQMTASSAAHPSTPTAPT